MPADQLTTYNDISKPIYRRYDDKTNAMEYDDSIADDQQISNS